MRPGAHLYCPVLNSNDGAECQVYARGLTDLVSFGPATPIQGKGTYAFSTDHEIEAQRS